MKIKPKLPNRSSSAAQTPTSQIQRHSGRCVSAKSNGRAAASCRRLHQGHQVPRSRRRLRSSALPCSTSPQAGRDHARRLPERERRGRVCAARACRRPVDHLRSADRVPQSRPAGGEQDADLSGRHHDWMARVNVLLPGRSHPAAGGQGRVLSGPRAGDHLRPFCLFRDQEGNGRDAEFLPRKFPPDHLHRAEPGRTLVRHHAARSSQLAGRWRSGLGQDRDPRGRLRYLGVGRRWISGSGPAGARRSTRWR